MRNKFEVECHKALCEEYGKNNVAYEPVSLPYSINYVYVPDFRVVDGSSIFFVESKGYFRNDNRRTMLAVRDQNNEVDLRIIFQKNQLLGKGSKTRYSDWADKHGFQYCIGVHNLEDIT